MSQFLSRIAVSLQFKQTVKSQNLPIPAEEIEKLVELLKCDSKELAYKTMQLLLNCPDIQASEILLKICRGLIGVNSNGIYDSARCDQIYVSENDCVFGRIKRLSTHVKSADTIEIARIHLREDGSVTTWTTLVLRQALTGDAVSPFWDLACSQFASASPERKVLIVERLMAVRLKFPERFIDLLEEEIALFPPETGKDSPAGKLHEMYLVALAEWSSDTPRVDQALRKGLYHAKPEIRQVCYQLELTRLAKQNSDFLVSLIQAGLHDAERCVRITVKAAAERVVGILKEQKSTRLLSQLGNMLTIETYQCQGGGRNEISDLLLKAGVRLPAYYAPILESRIRGKNIYIGQYPELFTMIEPDWDSVDYLSSFVHFLSSDSPLGHDGDRKVYSIALNLLNSDALLKIGETLAYVGADVRATLIRLLLSISKDYEYQSTERSSRHGRRAVPSALAHAARTKLSVIAKTSWGGHMLWENFTTSEIPQSPLEFFLVPGSGAFCSRATKVMEQELNRGKLISPLNTVLIESIARYLRATEHREPDDSHFLRTLETYYFAHPEDYRKVEILNALLNYDTALAEKLAARKQVLN